MRKLHFKNYSRFSREGRGAKIFSWCVFLDEDPETINAIEMIEYTLHPTFRNPVREITDKEHCFALQSEGWGTFKINTRVFFEDGHDQIGDYLLRLEVDDWPKGPELNSPHDEPTRRVYGALTDPKWDWRKMSTIARAAALSTAVASPILTKLNSDGFIRKAYFRSIENEELWGATSRVGKLPVIDSK